MQSTTRYYFLQSTTQEVHYKTQNESNLHIQKCEHTSIIKQMTNC